MRILVKPPHGPVSITLKDGRVRYEGSKEDVAYVRMMVEDQAGALGHVNGMPTAFDLERRVYAAFGTSAELSTGISEIKPALERSQRNYLLHGRIQ